MGGVSADAERAVHGRRDRLADGWQEANTII